MKEYLGLLVWVVILWFVVGPHFSVILFFWGMLGVTWYHIDKWRRKKKEDDFP